MQHLKPGELIAIQHNNKNYTYLVLSKSAFLGCQWVFAFYNPMDRMPEAKDIQVNRSSGFFALVDFIEQRRKDLVIRIAQNIDVNPYFSFQRLKALIYEPDGSCSWYIYDKSFTIVSRMSTLSDAERDYPIASGMSAAYSFSLIDRKWNPSIVIATKNGGQFPRM